MTISALKKESTFEAAVNAIGDYIISNRLREGDPLPPESELAAAFGISRNIVREAFRHYRTLGIIESKPRAGAVIRSLVPENPYSGYFPFLAARDGVFEMLAELRITIETGAAEFIVAHAGAEQIKRLYNICDRSIGATEQEMFRLDEEFHIALLDAAGNPLISGMIPLLVRFFSEQSRRKDDGTSGKGVGYPEVWACHRRIIGAIEERDGRKLQTLMREHSGIYLPSGSGKSANG